MKSFMDETEMDGVAPLEQAKRAIMHALRQIKERPELSWYCGLGSQTYSLLTEAAATLCELNVEQVRLNYIHPEPVDPRKSAGEIPAPVMMAVTKTMVAAAASAIADNHAVKRRGCPLSYSFEFLRFHERESLIDDARAALCAGLTVNAGGAS